jgi:hypothetical protein
VREASLHRPLGAARRGVVAFEYLAENLKPQAIRFAINTDFC